MPSGTAATTPATSPRRNGIWYTATSRPATHAPKPAIAYCASESCPAYPVTTTIDSSTIEAHSVTVSASIHFVSLVSIRNTTAPARKIVQSHDMRPLPTAGSLRRKWSRSGSERPRNTSITMMSRNGNDWPAPC